MSVVMLLVEYVRLCRKVVAVSSGFFCWRKADTVANGAVNVFVTLVYELRTSNDPITRVSSLLVSDVVELTKHATILGRAGLTSGCPQGLRQSRRNARDELHKDKSQSGKNADSGVQDTPQFCVQ